MNQPVSKLLIRYSHSIKWRLVGIFLFLLAPFMPVITSGLFYAATWLFSPASPDINETTDGILLGILETGGKVLAAFLFYQGIVYFNRGRRWVAESAENVLQHDTRPSVVYLRSFEEDDLFGKETDGFVFTQEEILVEELTNIGPVIAIGRPGEELPQLGAARMYLDDSAWKSEISKTCETAALVVFKAGLSNGLLWEIEHIFKTVDHSRIVILIGDQHEKYRYFQLKFKIMTGYALPDLEYEHKPCRNMKEWFKTITTRMNMAKHTLFKSSFTGIVHFDQSHKPHITVITKNLVPVFKRRHRHKAAPYLHVALKPVYEQLGYKWVPPRLIFTTILTTIAFWAFIFVIIVVYIGDHLRQAQ